MAYLFDTDALSEVLRSRPQERYVQWLQTVGREDQYASAVSIGEMYRGAYRSPKTAYHIENIERRVLPAVTILPYDLGVARTYGSLRARLEQANQSLEEADLQIAATALAHDLVLVTGNIRHFQRVPGLSLSLVLAESRRA